MEVDLNKLVLDIQEVCIRLEESRHLLYNGREIPCDRKLQGALVKCNSILQSLSQQYADRAKPDDQVDAEN